MNDSDEANTHTAAMGEVGLVSPRDYHGEATLPLVNGGELRDWSLRYETYGRLNRSRDNTIWVCHALTGDHHCAGVHSMGDRKPGWWNEMIGPGKPLDTNQFHIVCANCLGGCAGSTGPASINPETGRRWGLDFPLVEIADMVAAQRRLAEHLGIQSIHAVVGGSMGGMQALQWGVDHPDLVRRVLAIATTARQSAQAIAFNEVGRSAIMQDPRWQAGQYAPGEGPNVGLSVARMMAHITYLSESAMEQKFGRARRRETEAGKDPAKLFAVEFEVESYLRYQGTSFVKRFDANSYLYLTKALDRFDLYGPANRLEDKLAPFQSRALVVGFTSDWLYPPSQNRAIVHALARLEKHVSYAEIDMPMGHDSFLVRAPQLFNLVRAFLETA